MLKQLILFPLLLLIVEARADDGYRLWLKYDLLANESKRAEYQRFAGFVEVLGEQTPIVRAAQVEIERGLEGLLGIKIEVAGKDHAAFRTLAGILVAKKI